MRRTPASALVSLAGAANLRPAPRTLQCNEPHRILKTTSRREEDATDPKSRHVGKLDTEKLLTEKGVNFTSIRPVYIYGPLNYNPVEEFFFHRLAKDRPICVPVSGMQVRPP
jgi:nucleoside-diphosphate-sugar epimerase